MFALLFLYVCPLRVRLLSFLLNLLFVYIIYAYNKNTMTSIQCCCCLNNCPRRTCPHTTRIACPTQWWWQMYCPIHRTTSPPDLCHILERKQREMMKIDLLLVDGGKWALTFNVLLESLWNHGLCTFNVFIGAFSFVQTCTNNKQTCCNHSWNEGKLRTYPTTSPCVSEFQCHRESQICRRMRKSIQICNNVQKRLLSSVVSMVPNSKLTCHQICCSWFVSFCVCSLWWKAIGWLNSVMGSSHVLRPLCFVSPNSSTKPVARSNRVIAAVCFQCALCVSRFLLLRHCISVSNKQSKYSDEFSGMSIGMYRTCAEFVGKPIQRISFLSFDIIFMAISTFNAS